MSQRPAEIWADGRPGVDNGYWFNDFQPDCTKYVRADLVATEGDVRELVEALSNLALSGVDDFGGSYVNLQADRADIAKARELIDKYPTPSGGESE